MGSIIRIVFVTPVFGPGVTGPETYAHYLWEGFANDPDIEFHLVAPEFTAANPRWHAAGRGAGSLDLYRCLAETALRVADELGSSRNPVLLHVNNSNLHQSLLNYAGPLWGQVNDYENADLWRRGWETIQRAGWRRFFALARRRWLERRFLTRQDLSLCNSDFTRTKILSEYHPPHPERIITLRKAIELKYFERPAGLNEDPLKRSALARKFVFVGRDFVRKGLDTLLQAVGGFPKNFDWHLAIIGVTREEFVRAFPNIPTLPESRILFAGTMDKEQLRRVLWTSDIFVLPSRAEALGVALLEALGAGLPVVATKIGGIPEIIQNSAAGLLVPPGDSAALAEALINIRPWSAGPPLEAKKILHAFSTEAMISRLRQLYLQIA